MTVKLLLWLVKLAVDASPADLSRLVSSRLVSSRLQFNPNCPGRRQPDVSSSPGLL